MGARRARRGPALLLAAAALRGAARPEEGRGGLEEVEAEEGLEEFDLSPEEQDMLARPHDAEGRRVERELLEHELGPGCLSVAESLEREVGLFDDRQMDDEGRQTLARRMAELAKSLWADAGGSAVERRFLKKLTQVQTGSDDASFGAQDACHLLLSEAGLLRSSRGSTEL